MHGSMLGLNTLGQGTVLAAFMGWIMYTISPGGYTVDAIAAWTLGDVVCKCNCQSEYKYDVM